MSEVLADAWAGNRQGIKQHLCGREAACDRLSSWQGWEVHECVEAGTPQARSVRSSEGLTLRLGQQRVGGADREAPGQPGGRRPAGMGNGQE